MQHVEEECDMTSSEFGANFSFITSLLWHVGLRPYYRLLLAVGPCWQRRDVASLQQRCLREPGRPQWSFWLAWAVESSWGPSRSWCALGWEQRPTSARCSNLAPSTGHVFGRCEMRQAHQAAWIGAPAYQADSSSHHRALECSEGRQQHGYKKKLQRRCLLPVVITFSSCWNICCLMYLVFWAA